MIMKRQVETYATNGYTYRGYWDGMYHYGRTERHGLVTAAKYTEENLLNGNSTILMTLNRTQGDDT